MPGPATLTPKPAAKSAAPKAAPTKAGVGPRPANPQKPASLPVFARGGIAAAAVKPSVVKSPLALPATGTGPLGQPLAPHVQEAIERSYRVDLSGVRLHADTAAQSRSKSLSARAFTYGGHIFLGPGEQSSDLELIAHEAAHVVQQQGQQGLQMWSSDRGDRYEREADHASAAVLRGESFAIRERLQEPRVQRLGISDALDYFADAAYNIPGYRMFTLVIGVNPINMEHVERNAANLIRAVVEFMPGGHLITDVLDKYGVIERVGNAVSAQLDSLGITGGSIRRLLMNFLDSLSWRDIFHLGDVWDRAKHLFTDIIDRIRNFVSGLVSVAWTIIREVVLRPLAELASRTAGWDLLIAVLGRNPITGEEVPRTADNLIGGFMKLIHQEEIWNNIKKANAIPRAWAWFQSALSGLMGFVRQIPSLFIDALHSLEWSDLLNLPAGFRKVATPFANFLGSFVSWAGNTIWDLLQIIFEVVAPSLMPYLRKVGASLRGILKNPIGFVRNLVAAAKAGFQSFAANILQHLKASFIEWLTGNLPGVYLPRSLDLFEIVKFVLSVLGLTWQNIRGKLVKAVGETAVKAMETGFDIVVTLVKDGPAAAWDKIKDELGNLRDTVMQAVMGFLIDTVVKKAVAKLLSLFVPGGAFIQAIISIYDTITVFVQKIAKIIQVVRAFLDSMMAIAAGSIGAAVERVESTLAGLLTLAISFLAGFIGLGGVAAKVMNIIDTRVRGPIDKALDKVITWVVEMARKAGRFVAQAGVPNDPEERLNLATSAASTAMNKFSGQRVGKLVLVPLLAAIKIRYGLTLLDIVPDGDEWLIEAVINPRRTKKTTVLVGKGDQVLESGLKKMPLVTVIFFAKKSLDREEFDRQLELQEDALREMTIQEWLLNRFRFKRRQRDKKGDREIKTIKTGFRSALAGREIADLPKNATEAQIRRSELLDMGAEEYLRFKMEAIEADSTLAGDEKRLKAAIRRRFKKSAGLHAADQVAGGRGRDLVGLGGAREDYSLGSAWRSRVPTVEKVARKVDSETRAVTKMNIKLKSEEG